MANKILVARGTKARIEAIKSSLSTNELVYSTDTGELGVKKAGGNIQYFMNSADINALVNALDSSKVDKVSGKGLSTNDYTDAEKVKLASIESGAQVNRVDSVNGKIGVVVLSQDDIADGASYKRVSQAEKDTWNNKQDKLIAGDNIAIDENNVISASSSSSSSYIDISYADLVALRDSSSLEKGAFYRIIDYETTTVQEGTRSAGHRFDIIVTALDEKTLSENAKAAHRKKELLPWFEHNKSDPAERFFYVDSVVIDGLTLHRWVSYEELNAGAWVPFHRPQYLLTETRDVSVGDTVLGYQIIDDGTYDVDYFRGSNANKIIVNVGEGYMPGPDYFDNSKLEAWELKYCLDNDTNRFAWADEVNGKGVIYYMRDEYNNEAPYDFKNIQFKRDLFYDSAYDITFVDVYLYTFSAYSYELATGVQGDIEDATIITKQETIDYCFNACYDNVIKPSFYTGTIDEPTWKLNNTVLVNTYASDSYFGCHSNTFGINCDSNTIGYNFSSNIIGNNFVSNTIGYNFSSNIIGNNFVSNTIGNNFRYNTIGNYFRYNTIGNSFNSNIVGNYFRYNTIGNNFTYSIVGNYFAYNIIENYFGYNTVGNYVLFIQFSVSGTSSNRIRYLYLKDGLSGSSSTNRLDLYFSGLYGRKYPTTFEIIANGNIVSSWEATPLTRAGKVKETKTTATWSDI